MRLSISIHKGAFVFYCIKKIIQGLAFVALTGGAQAAVETVSISLPDKWADVHFSESSNIGFAALGIGPFSFNPLAVSAGHISSTRSAFTDIDLTLSVPITSLTFESVTDERGRHQKARATRIVTTGGLNLSQAWRNGPPVEIINLEFDLIEKKVYGDILANGVTSKDMPVWSIDVVGPEWVAAMEIDCYFSDSCNSFERMYITGLSFEDATSTYLERRYLDDLSVRNLKMTKEASDLLMPALDIADYGRPYFEEHDAPANWTDWYNYASFSTSAVPEMGAGSMMLVGLAAMVGLAGFARRRGATA